jgi:hypothetical protein
MTNDLSRIEPVPKDGDEPLHYKGSPVGATLLDFWRWSSSDLVSNATRGVLAEFIVACALGVDLNEVRDEWGAFDLITPEGVTVEVKSAAYLQSWEQHKLSSVQFSVRKTKALDATTNLYKPEARRQARVYVFALLAHRDKRSVDPLNLDQWQFFVLPTALLDARTRSQHSITLPSLMALAGAAIGYEQLHEAVCQAGV